MYDPDDIRRSGREKRPPWEIEGGISGWFSDRRVEEPAAEYAQRRRAEEESDPRYSAVSEPDTPSEPEDSAAGGDSTPPPPRDLRGSRYNYPPRRPGQRRSRATMAGVAAIVVVALLVTGIVPLLATLLNDSVSYSDADWDLWEDYGGAEESTPDSGATNTPDVTVETDTDTEETTLEQAELTGELTVELQSAEGLTALTYQEIYAKCLPSTVSITVVTSEGVGTGTGIVMTEDGYILTCNHVIDGASTCQVTTSDDETYDALLVGGDAQTDLAVLKIDAQGLTPAEFGDSDELTVGDEALAIGDPLGTTLRGTLTNGIISAINRNVTVNNYSMTLLQTTAALNSGNSGGPLINIYGQVVGVNNMKMNSSTVTVEGLGFAVPTSVVSEIVPILSADGAVSRPVLGITCLGIDEDTAALYDYPVTGLLVSTVDENSDAYAQGLLAGDYITAVNGTAVVSVTDVKAIISDLSIGDTVELSIYRLDEESGQAEEFTLTVALVDQNDLS